MEYPLDQRIAVLLMISFILGSFFIHSIKGICKPLNWHMVATSSTLTALLALELLTVFGVFK